MALYLEVEGLDKISRVAEEIIFHVNEIKEISRKVGGYDGAGKVVIRLDGDTAKEERK